MNRTAMTMGLGGPKFGLVWFVIGIQLFVGCDIANFRYWKYGASTLSPSEGVLVIGRGDTLRGHYSTTWPLYPDGGYVITQYEVKARGGVNPLNSSWGFVATPAKHTGSLRPTETSEWKMWLSQNQPPSPGIYIIKVGGNQYDRPYPDDNAYIPEALLKVIVLDESSLFILTIVPDTSTVSQGTTNTIITRLIRAPGFTAPVQFELYQPPAGITATFNPPSVSGDTSIMQLMVGDLVAPGRYPLTVIGAGGGTSDTASFVVDVVAAMHSLVLNPNTLSLAAGQSGQVTVNVAGNHLPVTLLEPIEPHASFQFSPNPTSNTSTMTVNVDLQAQAGTRQIPIIGRFSNGQTARDTLTLSVVPGAQWRTVFAQSGVHLFGLDFENSSTGFGMAISQSAARSTDGGNSWTFANPPPSQANDIAVVGPMQAIAVGGNNKIMRTYDGGLSWTERSSGLTSGSFLAIGFNPLNPNIGVAVGRYGVITRTTNGGDDWVAVSQENTSSPHWYDVSLHGPNGTIVGASSFGFNGRILRSTDYGLSWSLQTTSTAGALNGVSFSSANDGIVVGHDGVILRTDDGGAQWDTLTSPVQAILYDVAMLTSHEATAVGSGGTILRTFDGGQTWVSQSVPPAAQSATLWKVFVFPNNSAVCVGNEFGCIILRRDPPTFLRPGNQKRGSLKLTR